MPEKEYRDIIRANLSNVLTSGFVPELGEHKQGKVRDVHISGNRIIMIASDRVSCFDHVLSRCIPFKGQVLNAFSEWAMANSSRVVRNAMLQSPGHNVVVQQQYPNVGIECVVRGFVWGSLAADYEKGERAKCGVKLPNSLLRYQKLPEPIFTPTTKAEAGHDLDMTLDDIAQKHGKEMAEKLRDVSTRLYLTGAELAARAGMLFIDTKFEFGLDGTDLVLIDESFTPDSSRFCDAQEYRMKYERIIELMRYVKYRNVSELLKEHPDLKITEASKQFVRDVLIEGGYKDGQPIPDLTDEQVVETAFRYITSYERLTGRKFDFSASALNPRRRIMANLQRAGLAYGGCVVPIGASEKDKEHWEKIEKALNDAKVPFTAPVYLSAHKQTQQVLNYVAGMDASIEPIVYLTFVGRSNGLGPVVAGNTKRPVITCPVFSDTAAYGVDIHSSLRMPGNLPLMTVVDPGNAALAAKRIIDEAK